MSVLDKLLRRFGYAKRQRLGAYAAGMHSRLHADWYPNLWSADQNIKAHRHLLVARSRQMVRDNPHAVRLVELFQQNVIGPHGIRMQARVPKARPAPDAVGLGPNKPKPALRPTTNNALEEGWKDWGRRGVCTVDGKQSWDDVCDLAVATEFIDGEFLALRHRGFDNEHFYALQPIDSLQLDDALNSPPTDAANEIRQGVEVDRYNRPVAYHIWDGHPSEATRGLRRRIPAENVLHTFRHLWPGQTRGVPALTPVLLRLNLLDGYEEAEIVAAKSAAAKSVVWEADPAFPGVFDGIATDSAEANKQGLTTPVEAGMQQIGPIGFKAHEIDPTHPTTAYPEFTKAQLRAIAAGVGVAYTSLTGDLSDANYGSQRGGLLAERDGWRKQQRRFQQHVCEPVFLDWRTMSQTSGRLSVPQTMDAKKLDNIRWQFRGWPWIDPHADAQADELLIALGCKSRSQVCAEQGRDFEEVIEESAQDQDIADQYGVDIEGLNKAPPPGFGEDGEAEKDKPPFGDGEGDDPKKAKDAKKKNGNGNGRFGHVSLAELIP